MLSRVSGAPLLAWLAGALFQSGVSRFFLVCREPQLAAARACFPEGAELTVAADNDPADLLHVFLSTAEEDEREVTVITGAVAYLPTRAVQEGKRANAYLASREALMAALDQDFSFSRFLRENCTVLSDYDGFYSVESEADAVRLAPALRQEQLLRLLRQGVEIYDPESCYIEPGVQVEPGAVLLPGTMLRGRTVIEKNAVIGPWSVIEDAHIGAGCTVNASQISGAILHDQVSVGPYARIRPGSELEDNVKIGNFVEVKNARIGEDTFVSHLSYLGDALVGARCNFGSGTATANFDRREKHQTVVGDDAFLGCHTALVAPVEIGSGAYIAAGSVITEDVPPNALGVARARQTNKKDWAGKHKK